MANLPPASSAGKQESVESPLMTEALRYAGWGWRVFPLCSSRVGCPSAHSKGPCEQPGKVPLTRNGCKDASNDESVIRGWWKRWPEANIGIATGPESGLAVLDVDGDDAHTKVQEWEREHGLIPATFSVLTGRVSEDGRRNGTQFYFAYPPGHDLRNSRGILGEGIDVRGKGGYVVAPPSLHFSGMEYGWIGDAKSLAVIPPWLLQKMMPGKGDTPGKGESLARGSRNTTLASKAGFDRWLGASPEDLEKSVMAEKCEGTFSDDERLGIARSIARYPVGKKNLHWMPLHMSDWDGMLVVKSGTSAERGMCFCLMVKAWKHQGFLRDDALLWRFAQASSQKEFDDSRPILLSGFEVQDSDDGKVLVHLRIEALWREQSAKHSQTIKAGKLSAEKRANGRRLG